MNLDLRSLLAPFLAIVILGVVGLQTSDALRRSGSWGTRRTPVSAPPDPYARLETLLSQPETGLADSELRDPFSYGRAPAPVVQGRPSQPVAPVMPARPVVTAILADADPRALLRYQDREYTVKPGDLFADFRVISITAEEVVLDRGGQRLALHRPTKGE